MQLFGELYKYLLEYYEFVTVVSSLRILYM